jgi:hypothetical protein
LVLDKAAAILGSGVAKLLELLASRRLASADALLDLTFRRRFALGLDAGRYLLQPIFPLDLAHDDFLSPVVVAIASNAAIKADAVGQDMDMLMLGIDMPGYDELVFIEPHAFHVAFSYLPPLLVRDLFSRCRR